MKRERFPLTSDQMELLLAFESVGNLERLADHMAKDQSVISRNLRMLADDWPVLVKSSGRWQITALGRQVNAISREYQAKLNGLTDILNQKKWAPQSVSLSRKSALIMINVQKALQDPAIGRRNNSEAEGNIQRLVNHFRKRKMTVIHVRHVSENPASFFHPTSVGFDFIDGLGPKKAEAILEKKRASAFSGTGLEQQLRSRKIETLVLAGFTAGECIDATARQANDLGFNVIIAADATATFDIRGPKGQLHKAEKIHKGTLAVLHSLFAEVVEVDALRID